MPNPEVESAAKRNLNVPDIRPTARQTCRAAPVLNPAVVFFIGGAGDKEPYLFIAGPFKNIVDAQNRFNMMLEDLLGYLEYVPVYLGYNEVRGKENIKLNVLKEIPSKKSRVYIVGHSLGGWNGAHLSSVLTGLGYTVEMLVTLDPVGEGAMVWSVSNIYRRKPIPLAKFWINIRANPTKPDGSDVIAEMGERWEVQSGPNMNYIVDVNHYNAKTMFTMPLKYKKSAAILLEESIRSTEVK